MRVPVESARTSEPMPAAAQYLKEVVRGDRRLQFLRRAEPARVVHPLIGVASLHPRPRQRRKVVCSGTDSAPPASSPLTVVMRTSRRLFERRLAQQQASTALKIAVRAHTEPEVRIPASRIPGAAPMRGRRVKITDDRVLHGPRMARPRPGRNREPMNGAAWLPQAILADHRPRSIGRSRLTSGRLYSSAVPLVGNRYPGPGHVVGCPFNADEPWLVVVRLSVCLVISAVSVSLAYGRKRLCQRGRTRVGRDRCDGCRRHRGRTVRLDTNERREAISDSGGRYVFTRLVPGEYRLEAEKSGFRRTTVETLVLAVNDAVTRNLQIEAGISARRSWSRQRRHGADEERRRLTCADARTISELPLNGRDWSKLVALHAGYHSGASNGPIRRIAELLQQLHHRRYRQQQRALERTAAERRAAAFSGPSFISNGSRSGIPGYHVQRRCHLRPQFRSADQRHHQVRHEPPHGSAYRVLARRRARCARLLQSRTLSRRSGRAVVPPFNQHLFGWTAGGPLQQRSPLLLPEL